MLTDARVIGILLVHPWAFSSGKLKNNIESRLEFTLWITVPPTINLSIKTRVILICLKIQAIQLIILYQLTKFVTPCYNNFPYLEYKFFLNFLFDSLRPMNNLSVIKGRVFLGWTSTKLGLMSLAQGHNAVTPMRLEPGAPWSRVKHSTTDSFITSCQWPNMQGQ